MKRYEAAKSNSEKGAVQPAEHDQEGVAANIQNIVGCHRPQEVEEGCRRHPEEDEQGIQDEEVKVLVIVETDTVVDPRTVVIHLQDTPLADSAVVAAIRLDFHTFAAPATTTIELLLDGTPLCLLSKPFVVLLLPCKEFPRNMHALTLHFETSIPFGHAARIHHNAHRKAPDEEEDENVMDDEADDSKHRSWRLILQQHAAVDGNVDPVRDDDDENNNHGRHEIDEPQQKVVSVAPAKDV